MQLRDYQIKLAQEGEDILLKHKILFLAAEMRVGKTLVALEIARSMGMKHVLFVTKKKAIGSIELDYETFGFRFDIVITNYEALHLVDRESKFDMVIADESHTLGAFPKPNQCTKQLKELTGNAFYILLSGTPSPESYAQLYHQFWVSAFSPFNQWPTFYKWVQAGFVFPTTMRISGYTITNYSNANKPTIDTYTKKYFLTFTQAQAKFEVVDLQDKIITVPTDANLKEFVKLVLRDRYVEFKDGSELICDTAVKLQNKVHQICSGTIITETGVKVLDRFKALYIKNNYVGRKIAIYYLFQAEGLVLKSMFPKWTDNPEKFNKSGKSVPFISQFQAGSRGINLSSAEVIIFYNIHFSSELYQQARQRGQEKNKLTATELHWLFSEIGFEKKVYDTVRRKQSYTLSYFSKDYL